jgi:hypothetical protein
LVTVTSGSGSGTPDAYYKANIGGIDYVQIVTDNNGFIAGSGLGGTDDVIISASIDYEYPPAPPNTTQIGIDKGLMHNYTSATDADFKAFFAPGAYPYEIPNSITYPTGEGITINWTDGNGNNWNTNFGSGDQTGSTFTIISVEDVYDLTGTYYLKVKVQFKCKLYKENTGEMKQLINGEFVGYFGKI